MALDEQRVRDLEKVQERHASILQNQEKILDKLSSFHLSTIESGARDRMEQDHLAIKVDELTKKVDNYGSDIVSMKSGLETLLQEKRDEAKMSKAKDFVKWIIASLAAAGLSFGAIKYGESKSDTASLEKRPGITTEGPPK